LRKKLGFSILLVVALGLMNSSCAQGIPTYYGGQLEEETWGRVLRTGTGMFESSADFQHNPGEAVLVHRLADGGVEINFRVFWWWHFYNGEVAANKSVVDLYYDEELMERLEDFIDDQLGQLDPERIYAVTLSEEEPLYALKYFWSPESQSRYNSTYHDETGLWLRGQHGLNRNQEQALNAWLSEKTVHVFNRLYDHVKARWPNVEVFQFITPNPGAPAVFGGGLDLTGLKSDAVKADLYYYDVYDNPFWLYEYVRHAKTVFPGKDYHIWLWGEEAWPEGGLAGGFEHIRRNAWVAYLAGADAVGWFNWHYEHGDIWGREDVLGLQLIEYTNKLSRELEKLPPMRPQPEVLVIREVPMSFQLGLACDLGILNEWDSATQTAVASDLVDLSRYRLVIANEAVYHDGVVERLNDYVRAGGNLLLLGGFGAGQRNFQDDGARETAFLIEEAVTQETVWGEVAVSVSTPNPLNLELSYSHLNTSDALLGIRLDTLTESHQPLGEFLSVSGDRSTTPLDCSPLVLYRNSSRPEEGWTLYWGGQLTRAEAEEGFEDIVEAFIPDLKQTRSIYRDLVRAFAGRLLGIGASTNSRTEEMMITQTEVGEGVILAGISSHQPETTNLNYALDLDRFGLAQGEYWVHSLDQNRSLGAFESKGDLLEVPIEVEAHGTRLLLISRTRPNPSYSVDVSPEVPTVEEATGLWRFRLSVESDHGTVSGGGSYDPGAEATFRVSPNIVTESEGVRYVFMGWSSEDGGYEGSDNPATVTISGDYTESATWKVQYYLAMEAEIGGSVTPTPGWYDSGSEVLITAKAGEGFALSSWIGSGGGSYSGTRYSAVVKLDGPVTQRAVFIDTSLPVAKAGSDVKVRTGRNFVLDGTKSTDNIGIVSYEWSIDGGPAQFGPIAIMSFDQPGSYTATLTVRDAVGNFDTDTVSITIEASPGGGGFNIGIPPWMLAIIVLGFVLGILPYIFVRGTTGNR